MHRARGFSLAELLMVVIIVGVLATLVVPRFLPQSEKARVNEAVQILSAIRQGEAAYFLDNGAYLALTLTHTDVDWRKIGMENPNDDSVLFDYTVAVNNAASPPTFTATATRTSASDPAGTYTGSTVTLNESGIWGGTHPFRP
jgi:prepilin-type N-terminal cleavage/methylation domain-containing protein